MAKRILTEAQKEARRVRAKKRREARKAAAAAGTPIEKKPRTKKTRDPKPVEVLPEVLAQVTTATTEDDLIAPRKAKKSRKTVKTDIEAMAESKPVTDLDSLDSVKAHTFNRFSDKDEYKSVGYMVKTPTGKSILRGLFCKINSDGKIDKSEYSKLENVQDEPGFLGFVKDWSLAKTDAC